MDWSQTLDFCTFLAKRVACYALACAVFVLTPVSNANAQHSIGWTTIHPSPPTDRSQHCMAFDEAHGETVVFGGQFLDIPNPTLLGDTWTWDGTTWHLAATSGPAARIRASMAYDQASSTVILFGGEANGQKFGDTWIWDGTTWTNAANDGPLPRSGAAMTYDAANGVVLLYGGFGPSGRMDDLWEWNGSMWSEIDEGPVTPGPLEGSTMAFDPVCGRTVLFGGFGPNGFSQDVFEWDGNVWTEISDPNGPSSRDFCSMAYDSTNSGIILFGGMNNGIPQNDTWLWDGIQWTLMATGDPGLKSYQAMAADTVRNVLVLFGGGGGDRMSEWNGTAWNAVNLGPAPRDGQAMAFNPDTNLCMMYGGFAPAAAPDSFTWDDNQFGSLPDAMRSLGGVHAAYDANRHMLVVFGGQGQNGIPLNDTQEFNGQNWSDNELTGPNGRIDAGTVYDSQNHVVIVAGGYYGTHSVYGDTWS